ncbi:SapC family protein [Catenovulum sediminis]|uniref:SapC family protein n=1 Tax=Catenovulum sediminis TaxID=1740262 RepID=UPI00117CC81C|nr:SapC family protein [Catenovulum sediminis]
MSSTNNNIVALNPEHHRDIRIKSELIEQHGSQLHLVPAVLSEFIKLAVHYPIVITKNSQTGQFMCSAMLGLSQGENLFWQADKWNAVYVPLQVRRQPFFVGQEKEEGADKARFVLCIDENSPAISQTEGQALFDDAGEETEFFKNSRSIISEILQGEPLTRDFLTHLERLDLIEAISLDITLANQQQMKINGLYTISQDKLADLDAEQLKQLQTKGYLGPAYCLAHSVAQIYALIDRKNQQLT